MTIEARISRPRRVFITGANGFIGHALAQRYRGYGAEVCGVDMSADPAWNVVAGDLREVDRWRKQLDGADLVIHTAAVVSTVAPMRSA
jgi:nucleoside-diphosphate-sugar epimerase